MLPILGGDYPLENHFARYFARPGLAAVLGRRDKLLEPASIEDVNKILRQAAIDARQALDWIDPRQVLHLLAACDTAVPVRKGWELRRAMGKPETLLFPTGHHSTLIFIPCIRSQCLRFFRERYAEPH